MSDFKTRLRDEILQMRDRVEKLNAFIGTPAFYGLSSVERNRLNEQSFHMASYLDVLEERVEALGIDL